MTNKKEKDFQTFLNILKLAASRVDKDYIDFKIACENKEECYKFRERVYCYELYHQLRCILGENKKFPYKLNGEVDKAGCNLISNNKKPDFIVHVPSEMEHNLVVIEVKSFKGIDNINGLKKDVDTIKSFKENSYYKGIILIYGKENDRKNSNLPESAEKMLREFGKGNNKVTILWHNEIGKKPKELFSEKGLK